MFPALHSGTTDREHWSNYLTHVTEHQNKGDWTKDGCQDCTRKVNAKEHGYWKGHCRYRSQSVRVSSTCTTANVPSCQSRQYCFTYQAAIPQTQPQKDATKREMSAVVVSPWKISVLSQIARGDFYRESRQCYISARSSRKSNSLS